MKLTDVEFQADNLKATFYYSADERVDFRELIKLLASEFKVRVEMRQISLRQEAGRIGGIGSCGRELCCSTWLTEFKTVSTSAARYQNLSLNPAKLSGQCGRLKCCLNYELETYMDALIDIPKLEGPLKTTNGQAYLQKVDIFNKMLWFSLKNNPNWVPVPAATVVKYQELNSKGELINNFTVDQSIQHRNAAVQKALEREKVKRDTTPAPKSDRPNRQNAAAPKAEEAGKDARRKNFGKKRAFGQPQGQHQQPNKQKQVRKKSEADKARQLYRDKAKASPVAGDQKPAENQQTSGMRKTGKPSKNRNRKSRNRGSKPSPPHGTKPE
jgi:cell fate regulator YaaT (PSP1 superfamily)